MQPQQPIQDVMPPANDPGTLQNTLPGQKPVLSEVPDAGASANPIAGTAAPRSTVIHEQPVGDQALDSVLQNVTSNLKAAPQPVQPKPKKKFSLFGGNNKKQAPLQQQSPQAPSPNPIQQKTPKPKKPVLPITMALLAATVLAVAAIFAF